MKLMCINKNREGWFVDDVRVYKTSVQRVTGSLHAGNRVVRKSFDVALAADNTFQVDVGTGSGVKVKFQLLK